ncbi:hypothetical protein [Endozoicomonas sp. 4G]|uniref:hypothetical protein n=1 Tax=Endozoicomonas sp. 4G TaxID=2872754 RepID=UPI0020786440|nr:hypothetical protein [Endozoicomonas sp. 4G]
MSASVFPFAANENAVKNKINVTSLTILLIFKISQTFYFPASAGYKAARPVFWFGGDYCRSGGLFAIN